MTCSRPPSRVLSAVARTAIRTVHHAQFARFKRMTARAAQSQEQWLLDRIRRCEQTQFGRDHHFSSIRTVGDFRRQVPVSKYDYFAPYIDAVAAGTTEALIPADDRLLRFTITTGSTGVPKLNPVTRTWLKQYRFVWELWGLQMFVDHADRLGESMLQMAGTWDMGQTKAGIPISMVSALLARHQNPFVRQFYAVPSDLNDITDPTARYYTALRLCVTQPIGWIILMNPGTLIRLAEIGHDHRESLIRDLANGTLTDQFDVPDSIRQAIAPRIRPKHAECARELERVVERTGTLYPKDYWRPPVVGCWIGGTAGFQMRYLPQYFGDAALRDMGLVSSEGRHTIPLEDGKPEGVLAIPAGYYEFLPVSEAVSADPIVLAGHELERDRHYHLLMTTAAGFYRFDVGDVVCCRGFFGEAPVLEFVQKGDRCGDLEGEKLTEHQFLQCAHDVATRLGLSLGHVTAVPIRDEERVPRYLILLEEQDVSGPDMPERYLRELDEQLKQINFLYRARRGEGVLGTPQLLRIPSGSWETFIREETARRGTGDYQYKHPGLVQDPDWPNQFSVIDRTELLDA